MSLSTVPAEVRDFWMGRLSGEGPALLGREPGPYQTACGVYETVAFAGADGVELSARSIRPRLMEPRGCVVEFHDAGRPVRGWHHLSRWLGMGLAVVSAERRPWSEDVCEGWDLDATGPADLALVRQEEDAWLACGLARSLHPGLPIALFGEGYGAGLALVAGELDSLLGNPPAAVCLLNPLPLDSRAVWEKGSPAQLYSGITRYFRTRDPEARGASALFEALSFAEGKTLAAALEAPVLLGTSLMDEVALPETQFDLASRLPGPVRHISYPRWGHERVNAFEDAALSFLVECLEHGRPLDSPDQDTEEKGPNHV